MSKCLSHFTPTLPFPASSPPPSPRQPPSPLSTLPPSCLPDQSWVRPDPTTAMSPALMAVTPPPDIAPVSDESQYTGWRYFGGGGRTSPPPPTPLPSLPRPAVGKPTCLPCPASSAFLPASRPPCGENHQGSSQYRVTWPRSPRQIEELPGPTTCKRSQMSGGQPPTIIGSLKSSPTTSAPSSDFQSPPSSGHPMPWSLCQGILMTTPSSNISCIPESPLPQPLQIPLHYSGANFRGLVGPMVFTIWLEIYQNRTKIIFIWLASFYNIIIIVRGESIKSKHGMSLDRGLYDVIQTVNTSKE